jgi:ArsR family transcriptional regulator, arsenate/arsenite/antimonite-responsive transcriptional repressor
MSRIEQGHPRIEIRAWPGLALSSALQTVLFVDELPGIGEDFEHAGHSIEPALADSILSFLLTRMPTALMILSQRHQTTLLDPEPFLDWVEGLNAEELSASAHAGDHSEKKSRHEEVRSAESSHPESPAAWTLSRANEAQQAQASLLLENPPELKAMVVSTLRSFWENHFRTIYASHNEAMQLVLDEVRPPTTLAGLSTLLEDLLGRSIQLEADWTDEHERILIVPFPFMGPYAVLMDTTEPEAALILAFDAERAMVLGIDSPTGPDVTKLKALADETRLEILRFVGRSERFGGEIVTHLGISQPGISRHLRLLTASGLLDVRQEGTSKFYSTRDRELDAIADGIRQLKSDAKSNSKGGNR